MTTPVVGYITATGEVLCLRCASADAKHEPIYDPAPNGIYKPVKGSEHYDAACVECGWPVRRTQ